MDQTAPKIGTILTGTEHRDCVHMAVYPCRAAYLLLPGQKAGLNASGEAVSRMQGVEAIGIVDPFLADLVQPGQWFYLWLLPGTITSMRHVFTHPAIKVFPPAPPPPPAPIVEEPDIDEEDINCAGRC